MKTRFNPIKGCLVLLALTAFPIASAQCAEPLATFYPDLEQYTGAFAAYGGTEVDADDPALLKLSNEKTVGVVRWFVKHRPLSKDEASSWQGKFLVVELRALSGTQVAKVSTAWRGELDPIELTQPTEAEANFAEDKWTTVSVPVPDVAGIEGDGITGLVIKVEPGGQYEVKRIEVAEKPETNN